MIEKFNRWYDSIQNPNLRFLLMILLTCPVWLSALAPNPSVFLACMVWFITLMTVRVPYVERAKARRRR